MQGPQRLSLAVAALRMCIGTPASASPRPETPCDERNAFDA